MLVLLFVWLFDKAIPFHLANFLQFCYTHWLLVPPICLTYCLFIAVIALSFLSWCFAVFHGLPGGWPFPFCLYSHQIFNTADQEQPTSFAIFHEFSNPFRCLNWQRFRLSRFLSILQVRVLSLNCRLICICRLALVFIWEMQITRRFHNLFLSVDFPRRYKSHLFFCYGWSLQYSLSW